MCLSGYSDIASVALQPYSPQYEADADNRFDDALRAHVKVYFCADRYLIAGCKVYALEYIRAFIILRCDPKELFRTSTIVEIAETVFSNSTETKDTLLDFHFRCFKANSVLVHKNQSLLNLLVEHVPEIFSFGTALNERLAARDGEVKARRGNAKDLQTEIQRLRIYNEAITNENARLRNASGRSDGFGLNMDNGLEPYEGIYPGGDPDAFLQLESMFSSS